MSQTLQIYGRLLSKPKSENKTNEKKKKDKKQTEKQDFLAQGELVRSSNKVFFCRNRRPYSAVRLMTADMEGLRKVFNAIRID